MINPVSKAEDIHALMKNNSTYKIPISIRKLARSIGINIIEYRFRSLDGFIFSCNGSCVLFYNVNNITGRSRFTIAHEIGHYVLGHKTCADNNKLIESQADRFAEEILMPAKMFELSYIYYLKGVSDSHKPRELARIYGVSRQAARLRIKRLRLE